jgi:phosphohistidine phosphatase
MATAEALIERVRATDAGVQTLLIIGHNPGLEDLARMLAGKGDAAARKRLAASFPTSALAVIDFPSDDWTDVREQAGTLAHYVTPQSLA